MARRGKPRARESQAGSLRIPRWRVGAPQESCRREKRTPWRKLWGSGRLRDAGAGTTSQVDGERSKLAGQEVPERGANEGYLCRTMIGRGQLGGIWTALTPTFGMLQVGLILLCPTFFFPENAAPRINKIGGEAKAMTEEYYGTDISKQRIPPNRMPSRGDAAKHCS